MVMITHQTPHMALPITKTPPINSNGPHHQPQCLIARPDPVSLVAGNGVRPDPIFLFFYIVFQTQKRHPKVPFQVGSTVKKDQ